MDSNLYFEIEITRHRLGGSDDFSEGKERKERKGCRTSKLTTRSEL
jgi:hypothetical protein